MKTQIDRVENGEIQNAPSSSRIHSLLRSYCAAEEGRKRQIWIFFDGPFVLGGN